MGSSVKRQLVTQVTRSLRHGARDSTTEWDVKLPAGTALSRMAIYQTVSYPLPGSYPMSDVILHHHSRPMCLFKVLYLCLQLCQVQFRKQHVTCSRFKVLAVTTFPRNRDIISRALKCGGACPDINRIYVLLTVHRWRY